MNLLYLFQLQAYLQYIELISSSFIAFSIHQSVAHQVLAKLGLISFRNFFSQDIHIVLPVFFSASRCSRVLAWPGTSTVMTSSDNKCDKDFSSGLLLHFNVTAFQLGK